MSVFHTHTIEITIFLESLTFKRILKKCVVVDHSYEKL